MGKNGYRAAICWALMACGGGLSVHAAPEPVTGLIAPSAEERAWAERNMIVAESVRLNALGVSRVAADQTVVDVLGPMLIPEPVPYGEEVVGRTVHEIAAQSVPPISLHDATAPLPSAVDNSSDSQTREFFPPIRNQGGIGSCASWATLYYAMTYVTARERGWNARTGGLSRAFSPKWGYNASNRGNDNGSSVLGNIMIAAQHGAARWSEWPYHTTNQPLAYREWCPDPNVWRRALETRLSTYGVLAESDTEAGLQQLKTSLANGDVLIISTYVSSWRSTKIKDDPATTNDQPFINQTIAFEVNGTAGAHAMTVVGYNDHVWCDINSNNIVDPGEKGALKIANSWGTSDWNGGYRWISYDALSRTSRVAGWTSGSARQYGFFDRRPYWIQARASYMPSVVAEVTVRHARRSECSIRLGLGSPGAAAPSSTLTFSMPSGSAGGLGFDGRSYSHQPAAAPAFTLVYDFSALPAEDVRRFFVGLSNTSATNDPGLVLSYRLLTGTGALLAVCTNAGAGGLPLVASNAIMQFAWIDHDGSPPPPLRIATGDLPPGILGAPYDELLQAEGGVPPYQWQMLEGDWPEGLALGEAGRVEGSLQKAGRHDLAVVVWDAHGQSVHAEPSLWVFASMQADSDGDGVSDYHEWIAGTDPHDAFSRFVMRADGSAGSHAAPIAWSSQAGRRYQVWRANAVEGPYVPWSPWLPATPPRNSYADPTLADRAFYRVVVERDDD